MIGRRALVAVAIVAGLLAATIYFRATQRVSVVVAARELDATRALTADDLALRAYPSDALPAGVVEEPGRAVGRFLRAPLDAGQLIIAGSLLDRPGGLASGFVAPRGTRAVAIPARPENAVGGALAAGARVDLIAVPVSGRAPAGRAAEILAAGALVLDVRTESGAALSRTAARAGGLPAERIGSVVVAIPAQEELRVADRIVTSTFVFVLSGEAAPRAQQ